MPDNHLLSTGSHRGVEPPPPPPTFFPFLFLSSPPATLLVLSRPFILFDPFVLEELASQPASQASLSRTSSWPDVIGSIEMEGYETRILVAGPDKLRVGSFHEGNGGGEIRWTRKRSTENRFSLNGFEQRKEQPPARPRQRHLFPRRFLDL